MIFLPHTNTVILLEPYCGTITEPGLPVLKLDANYKIDNKHDMTIVILWKTTVTKRKKTW